MSEIRTESLVNQSGDNDSGLDLSTNDIVAVKTANTERMRVSADGSCRWTPDGTNVDMTIDSSGNLLVGKTATGYNTTAGTELWSNGFSAFTRDNAVTSYFNRKTSDGDIVQFLKDGTTVGSIGSNSSSIYALSGDTGILLYDFADEILPVGTSANTRDAAISLGRSATRFNDIYATNGTIQTSDQNEKQQIAALTDAEMTAAKAISQLFKTFKWNDSVAEKGADEARTHSGVIAQEVEQAMADAGLDAGDYAFFISTTWWEYDGETYDTLEEAPEGATERNRKGIRYPQLLSFVGAATEQRLASIETRLTALEAV